MAYKQDIELESGITASYWRITNIQNDYIQGNSAICFAGYVNKEARDSGKEFLKILVTNGPVIEPSDKTERAAAYDMVKEMQGSPFNGATNA